jgi:hypothetical protein
MDVFTDAPAAVKVYNAELAKLNWLESEIELLNLQHPFAGNIGLMINANAHTPIFGALSLHVGLNSSVPVDVQ